MRRILPAVLLFVSALCAGAQDKPLLRACLPDDLEPDLHFYRAMDKVAVVALNWRNTSDSACRIDPIGAAYPGQNKRTLAIAPGQTVHTSLRWNIDDGSGKKCDSVDFSLPQPGPGLSAFVPSLVPAACTNRMPAEYDAGSFVPEWPSPKIETLPLPEAPVLSAPKDTYNEREIIELRLQTKFPAASDGKCPALFEFIRNATGTTLREVQGVEVNTASGCKGVSPWGIWHGAEGEYPIEVMPNGVRGLDSVGKRVVSVAELADVGPDGEFRLVTSNAVTLNIVDPISIERHWGETDQGLRADLTLDKLSYPVGENIPLHIAFEDVSAELSVYGRTFQPMRCDFDHLLSPDIDYTVKVERQDGSKPQFFRVYKSSGGPCGPFPRKQLEPGKIVMVEDTLWDCELLPREPGVYKITVSWKAYRNNGGLDDSSVPELIAPFEQKPFVVLTSTPLLLTITPPSALP